MGFGNFIKNTGLATSLRLMLRGIKKRATLRMVRELPQSEPMPPVELPAPFHLQTFAPGDEDRWIELLNASREFGPWDRQRLRDELQSQLVPGGGIFVAGAGKLVGCAAVCFQEEYQPHALLMYVTVLSDLRGRGLGLTLVRKTMDVCQAQKFPGLILHTNNKRLAAVRAYLKLGFKPQLGRGVAGKRQWSEVLSRAFLQESERSPQ